MRQLVQKEFKTLVNLHLQAVEMIMRILMVLIPQQVHLYFQFICEFHQALPGP